MKEAERYTGWNVLVTAHRVEERDLLVELGDIGDFKPSGFKDVVIGMVESIQALLEKLTETHFTSACRVIPIETNFRITPKNLMKRLRTAVKPYANRIGKGESFCVRYERRGFKDRNSSKELEKKIGSYLQKLLREIHGEEPQVDLEKPDKMLVMETLGESCGVGLISKRMREKYYFVRI